MCSGHEDDKKCGLVSPLGVSAQQAVRVPVVSSCVRVSFQLLTDVAAAVRSHLICLMLVHLGFIMTSPKTLSLHLRISRAVHGSDDVFSRAGSGKVDPARPVILESLLTRPDP